MYCPPTMPLTPVAAASSPTAASTLRGLARLLGEHEPERLGVERVAGEDRDVLAELTWHVGRPRRRSSSSIAGRSSWISE